MIKKWFFKNLFELNGRPFVARQLRRFAMSEWSRPLIKPFIKLYDLQMHEASQSVGAYPTLHELFVRHLKEEARPIPQTEHAFVSPCDGVLSVVDDLTEESRFTVKGQLYSVAELLGSHHEAATYVGGRVLIFYLSPQNYHRVHVPIDGTVRTSYTLGRDSAPVNDLGLAYGTRPLTRNYRRVTRIVQGTHALEHVMVGALNVNTIVQTNHARDVRRGDEFGYFSFGSTVVLIAPKGALDLEDDVTGPVLMGQALGIWNS
ncbi:phosphatidylserine decarboxylase [Exiguobacterium oxidotolerans]|uniref:phosphatidylserine decarboxylase n=1 Tax=Exiguobacterium oxidotolerans TaxID=223958 RepID=A0A653IFW7_9BACL|nr:phosphatidylserine decarboxylase [Exiguobacterium oxidotolerans]VWX38100.1 Phosphatidylserine decarboxylase proenzyme [Exiguobacterium oxidotolerans]